MITHSFKGARYGLYLGHYDLNTKIRACITMGECGIRFEKQLTVCVERQQESSLLGMLECVHLKLILPQF